MASAADRRARLLRAESGFTLVETLATLAIMGVVLGGITSTMTTATRLESDLTHRYQAQQGIRLALTAFRREAHCASAVTPASGTSTAVTLTLTAGCTTGSGQVTWCTALSGGRIQLWRVPGASCIPSGPGAFLRATNLTSQSIFTPDATPHVLPSVAVNFSIYGGTHVYLLNDTIYLRNGVRQ